MAFRAYQVINIPDESAAVLTSEDSITISTETGEIIDIFPNYSSFPFNSRRIGNVLPNLEIKVLTQPVDDIPVILATLLKMGIPNQIDSLRAHGNREGLSLGWLITIWLVYIISQHDHRMNHVRDWVKESHDVLECLIGQSISETDFTDDRLADALRYLSQLASWNAFEGELSRRTIRVYDLNPQQVRLDATTASVNHDSNHSDVFKEGRTKSGNYDTQFKMMMATLDPLGLTLAVDVVAGNLSDDPLYLPIYHRIRETLGKKKLLYIGDCKMAALETRATIASNNDKYLTPLPQTGNNPELLSKQIDRIINEEVELIDVYHEKDIPQDPSQEPEPEKRLAQAFECSRSQTTTINDTEVKWDERVLIIRSETYAKSQIKLFERRLKRAEKELLALTPQPKQGRRQYRELKPLETKVAEILTRYQVTDYFDITLEREEKSRKIRGYRSRPARIEVKVRYQLHLTRQTEAIQAAKQRLGFRLYVTNESKERLSICQAVLAYREQHIEEQQFSRLKGPLAMTPLYVQRDDHALGLIRLLTVGLRAMSLFEFDVRRQLAQQKSKLSGIYAGNPRRATARPTTCRMLDNFRNITLTTIYVAEEPIFCHLTPLTQTQQEILRLLHLPISLYTYLAQLPLLPTQEETLILFALLQHSRLRLRGTEKCYEIKL